MDVIITRAYELVSIYAPFGVIAAFAAIGYVYSVKQNKDVCNVMHTDLTRRLTNQQRQWDWMLNTIFNIAQRHGVAAEPPPRSSDGTHN